MATPAELRAALEQFGLGDLFDVLNNAAIDPTVDVTDPDQLTRAIESNPTAKVALENRFSGNKARVASGMRPLPPKEYLQAEQTYIDTLRNNGMPIGFYDQQADLAKFIGGDVAPIELQGRIQRGYVAAQNAPESVRNQLKVLYGVDDSELASYFLDPTRATDVLGRKKNAVMLGQQVESARLAAEAAQQAGLGLTVRQAEALNAQGVSPETARQGFGQIAQQRGLFEAQMAGEQAVSQEEQISGVLGLNAEAAQRIATRRRRRQAEFEAGGGFATTQTGVSGLRTVGQ
jgi:hypothetical protein